MPNRVIRESMLDSTRYLSVEEGAQLLFNHLLLLADDFGCLSIEYPFIGRRCFTNRPTDDRLDNLMGQLVDSDLIRLYKYRNQRYAFIPRFRQRLKRETLKNPQPPDELMVDDLEAQEKFRKLNGHQYKGNALGTAYAGGRTSGAGERPSDAARPPADAIGNPALQKEVKERKEGRKTKDDVKKEGEGSGSESEENPAPAGDNRNATDLAAQLAEKMRLKESSKSESEKP